MTENTTKDAGSNLTAIAEYTETAAALADLRQRHQGVVYDVTQPKEMKKAKEARAELRGLRVALEKKRQELKAPVLERGRLLDSEAKRITEELVALEEPIDIQIKAEEARAEAERLAQLEAERQRVEAIQQKIQTLRDVAASLVGKPSVIIQGRLERLRSEAPTEEEFAEHFLTAQDAHTAAVARVEQQLQAQRDHEAEQRRIQQEREELERVRAENERLQRDAEKRRRADEERAAAARAEQERQEREAHEAEERRVAAIRTKIGELSFVPPVANWSSEEIDQLMADRAKEDPRDADNTFDFAEFHGEACDTFDKATSHLNEIRRAVVRREREEYEAAERRAEQERELAAERERQAAEQKRLDEQAEKLRREQAEAARKAEADRLASLTLRTAAQAVIQWAFDNGHDTVQVMRDLEAALDNDAAQAQPAATARARSKKAANA